MRDGVWLSGDEGLVCCRESSGIPATFLLWVAECASVVATVPGSSHVSPSVVARRIDSSVGDLLKDFVSTYLFEVIGKEGFVTLL